jgi:hypothetical protein
VTVYPGKLQNAFSPVIFLGWGINRFFALEIVALTIETSATSNVFDEKANLQATTIGAKISVPLGARTLASLRFGSGTAHLVLKNSNADTGVTCFIFCSTADTDSKFDGRSSMSGLAFVRGIGDKNPASFFSSAHVEFGYLEHQITYDQMHTLRFTREVSFTSQLQTYYIAIVASTR